MRFSGRVLLASAMVVSACGGSEKKATADTAAVATPAAADTAAAAPAGGAAPAAPAAAPAAPGKTVEVQMINDAKGTRFEPAEVTIKSGDAVKWVFKEGAGPHNIAFDSATAPAAVKTKLGADMPNQMAPLQSNFMMAPGDNYTVSFAGIPAGSYYYYCLPHSATGMHGKVVVQ